MQDKPSASDFDDTPSGWAAKLKVEFEAARKEVAKFHEEGELVLKRFRDEERRSDAARVVPLFTRNIQLTRAMLYGRTPKVSVSRKFADADDDDARLASVIADRLLNCETQRDDDSYVEALGNALDDLLLTGLGCAVVRYAATVDGAEVVSEEAEADYVNWKDQLWSAGSKVFRDRRWWAFRKLMGREQLRERFAAGLESGSPEHAAMEATIARIPMKGQQPGSEDKPQPWARAEVWEVWHREDGRVYWYVDGLDVTLDMREPSDAEGLVRFTSFWPAPRPMASNLTTSSEVPRSDYVLMRDSYEEVNRAQTRRSHLIEAIKPRALYDKRAANELSKLSEATDGDWVPVDNLAALSEKGGLEGLVQYMPIERLAQALEYLTAYKAEQIAEVDQLSGFSDLMRGQAAQSGVTASEQQLKARFGSVRMTALQNEFARFASDLQRLRFEVIAKRFSEQSIIQRSNILYTQDGKDLAAVQRAVALLKSRWSEYRVEVKPESINLEDMAALRQERSEVLMGLSTFFQAAAPLAQQFPASSKPLLELLKWNLSGLKGASEAEGILDGAIEELAAAQEQPQPPAPPDPKVVAQQMKSQAELVKIDRDLQADLVRLQAETQAKAEQERVQAEANVAEARAKHLVTQTFKPQPLRGSRPPRGEF